MNEKDKQFKRYAEERIKQVQPIIDKYLVSLKMNQIERLQSIRAHATRADTDFGVDSAEAVIKVFGKRLLFEYQDLAYTMGVLLDYARILDEVHTKLNEWALKEDFNSVEIHDLPKLVDVLRNIKRT